MRQVLQNVGIPDHVALAYDAWAPIGDDGKMPAGDDGKVRAKWLSELSGIAVSPDYSRAFERWKRTFSSPGDRLAELTLASRLLVGHGNASATDVGLTTHHTWGVPVIPGSALKGLVAHYVDAVYGPTEPSRKPWEQEGDERTRADYQGVTWHGGRIERGPGSVYRSLFGAPDAREDDAMREHGFDAGMASGRVTFHDALYVPDSIADNRPFAPDVLTVHQKRYYDSNGGDGPSDYDGPNPVAFLTVRPGARLLFALGGPPEQTELAEKLLRDALVGWGVGGKTSAGYGRLEPSEERRVAGSASRPSAAPRGTPGPAIKVGSRVEVVLLEERTKRGGWKGSYEGAELEGPVQNSQEIPADKKAGERIAVEVRIAKGKESAFRYLSAADAGPTKVKK